MKTIEFVTDADYARLQVQSEKNNAKPKRFQSVRYDDKRGSIALALAGGVELAVPVTHLRELADVAPKNLKDVRLSVSGDTVVFSTADVHISADGLLRDILARIPRDAIAAQFAASGGASTSAAKKLASASNGKLGGRPKKIAAA